MARELVFGVANGGSDVAGNAAIVREIVVVGATKPGA